MPDNNVTLTLQSVVNLAATHADLLPLAGVGGYSNEPALSLCNDTLQEMMSAPNAWKFNRIEMPMLVTAPQRQDYQFAGAVAFTLGSTSRGVGIGLASTPAISEAANTVTVNTLDPHGFAVGDTVYMQGNTVAAYNSTFTQDSNSSAWSGGWVILTTPTTKSFTFTHASSGLAVSGSPGITNFGWLESGTIIELASTSSPQNTRKLEAVYEIQPDWRVNQPSKVAIMKDNGDGTLKIRFGAVPGSVTWQVNLVYQAQAPIKTDLINNTWAPFPDTLSYVYRQGFLYRCYRYINSPRADAEYAKFQAVMNKALMRDDAETSDVHLTPDEGLMFDYQGWVL